MALKTNAAVLVAVVLLAVMLSGVASAQPPPMDMSWAFRSQMQNQMMGDYMARTTAMQYYQYMQWLRANGYTGPSLPTGVTPESLQRSIQGANQATQNYIQGSMQNSNRTSAAVNDWTNRAIRGCWWTRDYYGRPYQICP